MRKFLTFPIQVLLVVAPLVGSATEPLSTDALLNSDSFKKSIGEIRGCLKQSDFRGCLGGFWKEDKIYFTWGKGWKYVSSREYSEFLFADENLKKKFIEALQASSYPRLQAEKTPPETVWEHEGKKIKNSGAIAYFYGPECYRVELHRLATGWKIADFIQGDECGVK